MQPTRKEIHHLIRSKWFDLGEPVFCHWCKKRLHNIKRKSNTNDYCTVDHLIEQARFGTDAPENLVPSCAPCNTKRSAGVKGLKLKTLLDIQYPTNSKE